MAGPGLPVALDDAVAGMQAGVMRRLLIAMALFCIPAPVLAEAPWLDGPELRTGFAGRTVTGEYVDGLPFTETYWRDGGISYADGRQSDKGRWAIVGDQLCTFYQSMNGGCFRLRAAGGNCYQAYLAANAPPRPDEKILAKYLVAQFWRMGAPSSCPLPPSV